MNAPPDSYDTTIAELRKSATEVVRVRTATFKGKPRVDIRVFFRGDDGWLPTKRGISLPAEILGELIDALRKAGDSGAPRDRTSAERQRRYRERKRDGVTPSATPVAGVTPRNGDMPTGEFGGGERKLAD